MDSNELLTQKKALFDEARAIQVRVLNEQNGEWRGDDTAKFDDLTSRMDKIQATVERIAKLDSVEKQMTGSERTEGRKADPNPISRGVDGRPITDRDRNEAFRAWALAGSEKAELTDEQRSVAKRCGINLASKQFNFNLFSPVAMRASDLKSPRPEDIERWRSETRAALTGAQSTTTTGGYTVADGPMQALEEALLNFGAMRQVATVIRTDTGGPLPFPTTNDTAQKGRLLSENTAGTETEMTFGQLVIDTYKYSSDYVLASVEFLQDSSINAASFLASALAKRIGRLQNDHFTVGTGSSQPNGIVPASTSGVTSVADPPTYDNFVDLMHSVDPDYRVGARFMMNDTTLKTIKKIKVLQYSGDTTGIPLWQPSLVGGQPDSILGFPFVINQSMASPGSTAKKVLFGDFSKYIIRDVRDITVLRLDERFAELHQVAFLAFARADGDLLDAGTHPVKYMAQS